jgi:hypothetical protein
MELAHLLLVHTDPEHIGRLAKRLSTFSDVYIHVDSRVSIQPFTEAVDRRSNVRFVASRFPTEWGGWNAIEATAAMMREALEYKKYSRLVLLQGLDYPLKGPDEILHYFSENADVEFIRGCNATNSKDHYIYGLCKFHWFRNNRQEKRSIPTRAMGKALRYFRIKTRTGVIHDGARYSVFWGAAQWAITGDCANYVLEFYDTHPHFNRWFYYAFPPDELYFHTIIFNSEYAGRTTYGGPEQEARPLDSWRNLHYIESWRNLHYFEEVANASGRRRSGWRRLIAEPGRALDDFLATGFSAVFTEQDYERLRVRPELYIRKVSTGVSTGLLDRIDALSEARPGKSRDLV